MNTRQCQHATGRENTHSFVKQGRRGRGRFEYMSQQYQLKGIIDEWQRLIQSCLQVAAIAAAGLMHCCPAAEQGQRWRHIIGTSRQQRANGYGV